jgi:hypothetical protein
MTQERSMRDRATCGLLAAVSLCTLVTIVLVSAPLPFANAADPPATKPPETKPPETKPPQSPGNELSATQQSFLSNVSVDRADGRYQEGDKMSVAFQAERDAHLYLVYHLVDGRSVLLFPNAAHRESLVKAKQQVTVPAPGDKFRFRVRPPFGEEALQVVAAVSPIDEWNEIATADGGPPRLAAESIARVKGLIAASPAQFSEHRVRLHTSARQNAPVAESKPKRVGLFIGVNKYRDEKFCEPHEEFRRSAEAMHKMLTSRGGVAPERAKLMLGEKSTRANIQQAIVEWLPRTSEPGDTVFIYYCGHGGTVTNLDGSEPDGRDELITTFDNDVGKFDSPPAWEAALRKRTILDDTLARWLQELPGRQIVLLLDTCHGGGAVDAQGLAKFFSHEAARVKDISQLNMIVVAGCSADESVWFTKGPDALTRMPLYLMEAVEKLPAPVSVRQAYDHYLVQVQDYLRKINKAGAQEPTITDTALLPIALAP